MEPPDVFTFRSILVGICVGTIMCCSNMYFGLQTGWVTMGSIQSALLGFGAFKALQRCELGLGFTVAENVIIQTTSVAVAMMPLTAGLMSVIPALGMLTEDDNPPTGAVKLTTLELMLWTLSVAFFGAFAAVPLRKQTILKEKLRFPSGAATAKVIQLLHQRENGMVYYRLENGDDGRNSDDIDDMEGGISELSESCHGFEIDEGGKSRSCEAYEIPGDWAKSLMALLGCFTLAFGYKIMAELVEVHDNQILASFPILTWIGWETASRWGWVLYPAPGYIGQGMIMGPRTSASMLAGALMGFAVLGPIARRQGWAPGPIDNIDTGASGWVLWVSLAVMLGDSLTSLALLTVKTVALTRKTERQDVPNSPEEIGGVPHSWWMIGLVLSTVLCTGIVSKIFSIVVYEPVIAVVLAAFVSVLAVRALGETDLNPASGIGKISQIVFAGVAPGKVVANVIAGAIAEAGAIQAGDMMQDFKTAHLLGVPPRPQFFAQLIGSFVSVFISVGVFALYTTAWQIPSEELPVPAAHIWIDMARLFNGGALPQHVWIFALIFGIVAMIVVIIDPLLQQRGQSTWWLPSGIGFAVGMYLSPKFTIPRLIGSLIEQVWLRLSPRNHANLMVVVASGLVLGEGTGAIAVALYRMFKAIL